MIASFHLFIHSQTWPKCEKLGVSDQEAATRLVGAISSATALARGVQRGGGCGGRQGLGRHEGLVGRHAQLLKRVREEADLARALLAVIAQLRAVARGVQPVLEHIVRVGAGVAACAALVLFRR